MVNAGNVPLRLGIIAGSGPEAGADLWQKILDATRNLRGASFRGDLDAPDVTVLSRPTLGLSMELEVNDQQVWACMEEAVRDIAAHVDVFAIACNTLNYYQPKIEALGLSARMVSFADTVRDHLLAQGVRRVALLGALPVTDLGPWSHYRRLQGHVDIELPGPEQACQLQQLIYDIKTVGANSPALARRFMDIAASLESHTVLLACTELPLLAMPADGRDYLDVTDLVAQHMALLASDL
jgi:aspartate racemase